MSTKKILNLIKYLCIILAVLLIAIGFLPRKENLRETEPVTAFNDDPEGKDRIEESMAEDSIPVIKHLLTGTFTGNIREGSTKIFTFNEDGTYSGYTTGNDHAIGTYSLDMTLGKMYLTVRTNGSDDVYGITLDDNGSVILETGGTKIALIRKV